MGFEIDGNFLSKEEIIVSYLKNLRITGSGNIHAMNLCAKQLRMNLKHLTDKTLLNDTKSLVGKERELTTSILHHLKEIQNRRLFSDLKYPSLFAYCVHELGYAESSAQRRIVASRMLADLPQIEEKIEDGLLSLTNLAQANQFFNEQRIKTPEGKIEILNQIVCLSKDECERKLLQISGEEKKARESKQRISFDKTRVTIILSQRTLDEIEIVKNLLHKQLATDEFYRFMAKTTSDYLIRKKFKISPASSTVVEKGKAGGTHRSPPSRAW